MQNSLTHALIDRRGLLTALHGAANRDALARPAHLKLVWSADDGAPAMQVLRTDIDAAGAEIDDLLIL